MTSSERHHIRSSTWLPLAAGVVCALAGFAWWALGTTSEIEFTTATITTGPITRSIAATRTLQPGTTVEVGAQISGNVQSLSADYNSIVHKDQEVARLDPSLYDAQLKDARASLAQARATLSKSQADLLGLMTAVEDAQTKYMRAAAL